MNRKVLAGLLIFVVTVSLYFFLIRSKNQALTSAGSSLQVAKPTQSIDQKFQTQSSFNILFLGYGGGAHEGANLTDSMILAHFDTKNKIISLISIPRDIWVKIPTNGKNGSYWKVNSAFAIGLNDQDYPKKEDQFKGEAGGGNLAKHEVEIITGIPIDRYLGIDFQGFVSAIDLLGGVDVTVDKSFDDFEYPVEGKENDLCGHPESDLPSLQKIATTSASLAFPCRFEHIHFDKGVDHFDGESALRFVRSRHSLQDGTDFGRSNHQKSLLLAAKEKVYRLDSIPKLLPLFSTLKNNLKTDLTSTDIAAFLLHAGEVNRYQIKNLALTNQNFLTDSVSEDGQAILLPNEGVDQWGEIHNFLAQNLDNLAAIISPVIKVENGTQVPGLAELASNWLRDEDLNVLSPSSFDQTNLAKTTITVFNNRIDGQLIENLKKQFQVSEVQISSQPGQSFDILIVVGEDYHKTYGKKIIN